MPKQMTIYLEIFRLINTIEPKEKRNDFLGKLVDWYFKEEKPNFEPNSYEEIIWENVLKPINKYKSCLINGCKGGRPRRNKKTETKTEIKTESESETITTSDVIVVVNNNTLNNKENISKKDSNRDRGVEEEEEKENSSNSVTSFVENNLGRTISQYEYEQIKVYIQEYSEPIVLKAYQIAFEQNKTSLSYVKGILQNWRDCGLDTLEKINKDLKSGKKSTNERKLEKIFAGIDWGKDKHGSK